MYLKSLTLKGFKSFAETTTVDLEHGITVVVGPNGSGKSNIVDAVAWVLGAQGPSTVRSSKMDDVIFAGTEKRAALGRAEVMLTIDNASGMLPIELSEVTVSRTLFRSGDSEYALNGVPCRLLDVQELLSDSGVGRHQHVIVGQGQLDSILNARPEDRRAIIEEAAGILKFRKRKEKAERRLDATEANLLRLQDLLREVRRQLRPLERQADAARRHGALADELTVLRIHLAGREIASLQSRVEGSQRQASELDRAESAAKAELASLDAAVLSTEARLSALGGDDLGDALVRYERLREKAAGLAAVLAERRRGIERDRTAFVDAGVTATLEGEASRLRRELAEVEADARALAPDAARLADAEREASGARAEGDTERLAGELAIAETRRQAAERAAAAAEDAQRHADADHHRWVARAAALHDALEEARAATGAERLAGMAGVLGTLAELVEVDEGWEAAFEAAAGPALAAVLVRDADDARHALETLAASGTGTVLPLVPSRPGPALPPVGEPVRQHVRARRAGLDPVLDVLLGAAVAVPGDWREALAVATAHPDAVVVTRAGDRFVPTGWRIGATGSGATGAALEEARLRAGTAEAAAREAERRLAETRQALDAARQAERALVRQADDAAARARAAREARAAAVEERRSYRQQRLAEIERRLAGHAEERSRARDLQGELDHRLVATDRLASLVHGHATTAESELADIRERRRQQSEATRAAADELDQLRRRRHDGERDLEEVRERARRAELEGAEVKLRLETAVENLRRELDCEPDAAMAAACPPVPNGTSPPARLRELERELRLMGPINPLALEEFTALQERHEFLQGQLDDVRASRRELTKVIRAIDDEIVVVFAAAFADVAENFVTLFATLFPGGSGALRLTDPGNPLETGIEVEARPSGKNVRKLSLLSGGERSLTALAFLFAVFRSRPSPFYLLDEVEAALDDINLHRFLDLLDEFRREAQLVIVSHQKRTMEVADCLYGVSMQPGGSSKVVSERMTEPVG